MVSGTVIGNSFKKMRVKRAILIAVSNNSK